ncbi:hypothetical protein M011DRAFT_195132 [Sporormia fimetaria CBS 119925]|uniref:Uncharacterized protein n=1 Tax=Sporormia fimetaria CBS 119925 TaxID=1340428 RepID=A0A6A6V1D7_9PLEO|nr:hypothetical protein M011DRAFT_195132 [Sporormia fimetaria CBS 119925]
MSKTLASCFLPGMVGRCDCITASSPLCFQQDVSRQRRKETSRWRRWPCSNGLMFNLYISARSLRHHLHSIILRWVSPQYPFFLLWLSPRFRSMRLLTALCSALLAATFTPVSAVNNASVAAEECKHAVWPRNRVVYFKEPSEPQATFAIATKWRHYARDLRSLIPKQGFVLVQQPGRESPENACQWRQLSSVSNHGIHHGDVFLRVQPGTAVKRQADDEEAGVGSLPSTMTLHRVQSILRRGAPTRDIVKIVLMVIGPIIGTGIVVAIAYVLSLYLYPQPEEDFEEDIEMPRIRVMTSDITLTEMPAPPPSAKYNPFGTQASFGKEYSQDAVRVYRNDSAVHLQLGETYSISNYSS